MRASAGTACASAPPDSPALSSPEAVPARSSSGAARSASPSSSQRSPNLCLCSSVSRAAVSPAPAAVSARRGAACAAPAVSPAPAAAARGSGGRVRGPASSHACTLHTADVTVRARAQLPSAPTRRQRRHVSLAPAGTRGVPFRATRGTRGRLTPPRLSLAHSPRRPVRPAG